MILALSSSFSLGTVALFEDDGHLLRLWRQEKTSPFFQDWIYIILNEIYTQEGKTPSDIYEFMVDIGPGSFTGIRMAVSFVQAYVYALQALGQEATIYTLNVFDWWIHSYAQERKSPLEKTVSSYDGFVFCVQGNSKTWYRGRVNEHFQDLIIDTIETDKLIESYEERFQYILEPREKMGKELLFPYERYEGSIAYAPHEKKKRISWEELTPLYMRQGFSLDSSLDRGKR